VYQSSIAGASRHMQSIKRRKLFDYIYLSSSVVTIVVHPNGVAAGTTHWSLSSRGGSRIGCSLRCGYVPKCAGGSTYVVPGFSCCTAPHRTEQRGTAGQALVDLYTATNGPEWWINTNWLNGDPCGNLWYGVECGGTATLYTLYVPHFSL